MPREPKPRSRPSKKSLKYYSSSRDTIISGGRFEASVYRYEGATQGGLLERVDRHPDDVDVEITMFENMVGGRISGGTFIASGITVAYNQTAPSSPRREASSVVPAIPNPGQSMQIADTRAFANLGADTRMLPVPVNSTFGAGTHSQAMQGFLTMPPPQPQYMGQQQIPWNYYTDYRYFVEADDYPPTSRRLF